MAEATARVQLMFGSLDETLKERAQELAQEARRGLPAEVGIEATGGWVGYTAGRIQAAMEQAKDAGVLSERVVMQKHVQDRDAKIAELEARLESWVESEDVTRSTLRKTQDALAQSMRAEASLQAELEAVRRLAAKPTTVASMKISEGDGVGGVIATADSKAGAGHIITDAGESIPVATFREACTIHLPPGYIAWIGRKDLGRPAICTNNVPMQLLADMEKSRAELPDASRTSSMDNTTGAVLVEPLKITVGVDPCFGKSRSSVFATGGVLPRSSNVAVLVHDPRETIIPMAKRAAAKPERPATLVPWSSGCGRRAGVTLYGRSGERVHEVEWSHASDTDQSVQESRDAFVKGLTQWVREYAVDVLDFTGRPWASVDRKAAADSKVAASDEGPTGDSKDTDGFVISIRSGHSRDAFQSRVSDGPIAWAIKHASGKTLVVCCVPAISEGEAGRIASALMSLALYHTS